MYLNVQQRVGDYSINSQVSVKVIPRYLSTSEPQPGIYIYMYWKKRKQQLISGSGWMQMCPVLHKS